MSSRVYLITGVAGFFASHLVEHILKNEPASRIIGVDNLSYAGDLSRLRDVNLGDHSPLEDSRFRFMGWDFRLPAEPNLVRELQDVTHVIHAGGGTHVDHSIIDPMSFVTANVVGTTNVLNLARQLPDLEIFAFMSTDEVFSVPTPEMSPGGWKEGDRHKCANPYSATKSGAEQLVNAFANTYNLPCIILRAMNLIGERQHVEKMVPKAIRSVLTGELLPIHASPDKTKAGNRYYIHARNVADAYLFLFREQPWLKYPITHVDSYNVKGEAQIDNLSLALEIERTIKEITGRKPLKLNYEMVDFHTSRPGHEMSYMLDGAKMKGIGWTPPSTFHQSLRRTVTWYLDNPSWLGI